MPSFTELQGCILMSKEQGQQLGIDMANNFMLMTLFSIIAEMAEDPEGFRSDVKRGLLDLIDDYKLSGIAPETAEEARVTAKQIISGILAREADQVAKC
jgi:hypothetical protein